jgi:hypothetical protein
MKNALKYYVGINVKKDQRIVFSSYKPPTAKTHGRHYDASVGPFTSLRAAYYFRDNGANNPQIRCPADAEKLCRVRPGPGDQRPAAKLKRRPARVRRSARRVNKKAVSVNRKRRSVKRRKNPTGTFSRRTNPKRPFKPLNWTGKGKRWNVRRRKLSPAQLRAGFGGKAFRRRNPKTPSRTSSELKTYRDDIEHTDDAELCANLDRLLAGDESVREIVEDALDQIDVDLKKYANE